MQNTGLKRSERRSLEQSERQSQPKAMRATKPRAERVAKLLESKPINVFMLWFYLQATSNSMARAFLSVVTHEEILYVNRCYGFTSANMGGWRSSHAAPLLRRTTLKDPRHWRPTRNTSTISSGFNMTSAQLYVRAVPSFWTMVCLDLL